MLVRMDVLVQVLTSIALPAIAVSLGGASWSLLSRFVKRIFNRDEERERARLRAEVLGPSALAWSSLVSRLAMLSESDESASVEREAGDAGADAGDKVDHGDDGATAGEEGRVWSGRDLKLAAAKARRERGESPTQIARALGISRASVYRHLAADVQGA